MLAAAWIHTYTVCVVDNLLHVTAVHNRVCTYTHNNSIINFVVKI